jgi:hypothetical protein
MELHEKGIIMAENTYAQDLALLQGATDVIELSAGDASVIVAPEFQGRVMTSTLAGPDGASFGWLNEDAITGDKNDPLFNNYGGEDRFWLGPEAGQFGLWFQNGEPFDLDHWKTPAGFNQGAFSVISSTAESVAMETQFSVSNYSGATFECGVKRTVTILSSDRIASLLGADIDGLACVGFETANKLTNAGDSAWTRDTGLLSIWILGQYKPLASGAVIAPFNPGDEADLGPAAMTDYFCQLPAERGRIVDDALLFTCDGAFRSKIGISPKRSKDVVGSYDPDTGVLTIVKFNLPTDVAELPYVNSLWELQDAPFAGDVINSYNDGEAEPGAGQLGPFYEIETSSPAAEVGPGGSVVHVSATMHLSGDRDKIFALAKSVFGVDLANV